jgi:ligand-binding sensor domain-containing protein/serine phosphatase RsbU (regulator of sigma subunit)/ABC-type amino acid transport substrate-binding protein
MNSRLILSFFFTIFFFHTSFSFSRDIVSIRNSGRIYIGMTKDDKKNINYPLAVELAKYLNVELIIVEITWDDAFMINGTIPADVETNPTIIYNPDIFKKVDIICSTVTILEWRKKLFDFAKTLSSSEILVVNKDSSSITDFSMLEGKTVGFMKNTSFEIHITDINKSLKGGIKLYPTESSEESKELLREGKVLGIILDADEALILSSESGYEYSLSIPISPMTKTGWIVEKGNNLKIEVEDFFATIESNGALDRIFNDKFGISYSAYIERINKEVFHKKYQRDLNDILADGKLVVAFRDRKFIYQEGGEKQPMHALAEEFANYLGVSLEYIITPNLNKYWETEKGVIVRDSTYTPDWFNYFDVACELFSKLSWRSNKINLIPIYPSDYSVIAKKDRQIKNILDLRELKCVTSKGSSYEDELIKNKLTNFYYESANNFLSDIKAGKADYTIIDNAFSELSNYPEFESKISFGEVDICWGLRKDQPKLEAELRKFITQSKNNGLINILIEEMQKKTLYSPEALLKGYHKSLQSGQLPYILFGAAEGLPQGEILAIFQDKRDYMWFGTNSGAVRYNGREMKTISTLQGLGDNRVLSINQDSAGLIYLATSKGIAVYNKDTIVNRHFTNTSFRSVYVDKSNNKWFIGNDGIYILDSNGSEHQLNKEFTILPGIINSFSEDINSDDKYICTSQGLYYYSTGSSQISRLTNEECYCISTYLDGSVLISAKEGLFTGNSEDLKSGNFPSKSKCLNSLLNINNRIIKDILVDKYGSTWLISDSKIIEALSLDRSPIMLDQNSGLKNNKIQSFLIDKEDNIWVGYNGGLQRLSDKKGLRNFAPNIINSYIYSILQDESGLLWISSNDGVFCYDDKLMNYSSNLELDNSRFVMAQLPNRNLLFASSKGLYEVDPKKLTIIRKRLFDQMLVALENVFISSKGEIILFTGTENTLYYFTNFNSPYVILREELSSNIFKFIEKDGRILGGSSNNLIELSGGHLKSLAQFDCKIYSLYDEDNTLWIGTERGLGFIIGEDYNNLQLFQFGNNNVIKSIYPAQNKNYLWLGTNDGFTYFNKSTHNLEFYIDSNDGLSGDEITPSGLYIDNNNILWIGTYHGLSNFNIRAKSIKSYTPACYLEKVFLNSREIEIRSDNTFRHDQNNFVFEISALSFDDEKSIEYEFYLRGSSNEYSSYQKGKEFKAYFTNLLPGDYEFIYKAKSKNNVWSYTQKYEFTIRTAWYNTWIFRIAIVIMIMLAVFTLYKIRVRRIEAQKKRLEQLVKQRTQELEEANAEIKVQRDHATSQRDMIAEQKKNITDSIIYAEKIQQSLLPPVNLLKVILPEHFIFYKPRDIVSGDFYWISEKGSEIYLAAVDCTGHGVPGAFMSMLGVAFLNEIVNKYKDISPDKVLNLLRDNIIISLKQTGQVGVSRDGMDMSLVVIDKKQNTLSFAGANNPLYLVKNGELTEVKGDIMPIGIDDKMLPFTNHVFYIQSGDTFYIFSDGFPDQFGGPMNKKFMYSNFKKLLIKIQAESLSEQNKILNETIVQWKGNNDQTDDMVVIGLRF